MPPTAEPLSPPCLAGVSARSVATKQSRHSTGASSRSLRCARNDSRLIRPGDQLSYKDIRNRFDVPGLAFPNDENPKSQLLYFLGIRLISFSVAYKLRYPVISSGARRGCPPATLVSMPEASMDEDRPSAAAIRKVRATGQARHVFPVSEAELTQGDADPDFRRGVSTPYPRHVLGSGHRFARLSTLRPAAKIPTHPTRHRFH